MIIGVLSQPATIFGVVNDALGIDAFAPARLYACNPYTTTGLTLGYYGGTLSISGTLTTIANGTLALTANATNYVEAEPSTGAVSSNTTAFTSTRIQLYSIVTGASTVTSYTDMRSFIPSAQLGDAYGVATLDSTGHIPLGQLPAAIAGAMTYMGTWNASTNSPALASGVGTKGYYYKVATAGTTSLDGHAVWTVDDVAVFDGTTWDIIQGGTTAGEINTALGFTLSGTAGQTYTHPTTTATLARTDAGQTFAGVQNFTSPAITTNITTPSTSFDIFNTTATTVNAFGAATSLSIGAATGTLTLNNAAVKLGNGGTVTAPNLYFGTDTGTGLYRIGANNDGYAVSGAKVLDIASTGLAVTGAITSTVPAAGSFTTANIAGGTVGAPSLTLSTDTTTGLYCIGSNNDGYAVSGAKVLDISSTGLAVVGTISATSAVFGNPLSSIYHAFYLNGATDAGNAGIRNWAFTNGYTTFGSFEMRQSTAKGGDPIAAGTSIISISASGLAVTGALSATDSILSSNAISGIGYSAGAGGTVSQTVSKATGVTLAKACGTITLNNASLAGDTTVTFLLTITGATINTTDQLILSHTSVGTFGAYVLNARYASATTMNIDVHNCTPGALAEAIVIQYSLIRSVAA